MTPDEAPRDGATEEVSAVLFLDDLDDLFARAGTGFALAHELRKLRRRLPYGTEVELVVRWRARS